MIWDGLQGLMTHKDIKLIRTQVSRGGIYDACTPRPFPEPIKTIMESA